MTAAKQHVLDRDPGPPISARTGPTRGSVIGILMLAGIVTLLLLLGKPRHYSAELTQVQYEHPMHFESRDAIGGRGVAGHPPL